MLHSLLSLIHSSRISSGGSSTTSTAILLIFLDDDHAVVHFKWFQNLVVDDGELFFQFGSDFHEKAFLFPPYIDASRFHCQQPIASFFEEQFTVIAEYFCLVFLGDILIDDISSHYSF